MYIYIYIHNKKFNKLILKINNLYYNKNKYNNIVIYKN